MTNSTGGATRILGSLRAADGKGVVRIEDRYDTDIEDLWSAMTDPVRVARWYGVVTGNLRPGGLFQVHIEAAGLHGVGRVEVCEPPKRLLVVTTEIDEPWQQAGGAPLFDKTIEATLTADDGQTRLVIEARGMPLDKIAFYGVGWQMHAEKLAAYVAGHEAGGDHEARWGELVPSYQDLAATID
jgi:uncharacterized protein YndB with AHSA1/START domain